MDYEKLYYKLQEATDKQQKEADDAKRAERQRIKEQEAAQELADRQMREIINLNAEHRQQQERLAAAARRRMKARRQARAKAGNRTLASFLMVSVGAVGILSYLVGIGQGMEVLASLVISVGILLAVLAADKIRSKRRRSRRGKYERV